MTSEWIHMTADNWRVLEPILVKFTGAVKKELIGETMLMGYHVEAPWGPSVVRFRIMSKATPPPGKSSEIPATQTETVVHSADAGSAAPDAPATPRGDK